RRYLARTIKLDDVRLENAKDYIALTFPEINPEHIEQKKTYLQLKLEKKELKLLRNEKYFRIFEYKSKAFASEKEAEEHLEETIKIKQIDKYIDKKIIISERDKKNKINFFVKINSAKSNTKIIEKLSNLGYTENLNQRNKQQISSREQKWDPLDENISSGQLRDFFPTHNCYYPSFSIKYQRNAKEKAFDYFGNGKSDLEIAIDDAYKFYRKNTAVIDIEVIDYDPDEIPSGRIFMAVLRSETENKLYIIKEVWQNDKLKKQIQNKYKKFNGDIIYTEDEIDLIAVMHQDAKKYEYIIGHNYLGYDYKHLAKFNNEKKLDNIVKEQVNQKRKQYKSKRLWTKSKQKSMDSLKYLKSRIDLLKDHKLSTFAGFKKSIEYLEMIDLVKKGSLLSLSKVIDYTFEDGLRTKELMDKLLFNAVIECFAINQDLPRVFNNNPLINFYDSGKREYFMKMNTYRNRHDRSYKKHIEKLNARMSPEEILEELIKDVMQEEGIHNTEIYYPKTIFNAFSEIIENDPLKKMIKDRIEKENNPILKADLISKLSASVHVLVDKAKNYIEVAGHTFGKYVEPEQIYSFLKEKDPEKVTEAFLQEKDFELSRLSWIYGIEYGAKRRKEKYEGVPVEKTIIHFNNLLAEEIQKLKKQPIKGRTKNYLIGNEIDGIKIGNIRALNLTKGGPHKIIGKITEGEYLYDFFGNMKMPNNELIKSLIDKIIFQGNSINVEDIKKILCLDDEEKEKYRHVIRAISGIDPKYLKKEHINSINISKDGNFKMKYKQNKKSHGFDQYNLF
ncbi:hypothetical protein K9M18_04635, partial [Candidatus Woesearchaeota archaeon]|nr:hypothetical protein [Candidatus Woesearchaeota archaeon]